jgi:hypothetical protein
VQGVQDEHRAGEHDNLLHNFFSEMLPSSIRDKSNAFKNWFCPKISKYGQFRKKLSLTSIIWKINYYCPKRG